MLRISADDKAVIKAAAESRGKSLTTFITRAALKQARESQRRPPARGVHGGVPTFFRACCWEAQHGGSNGYTNAGWHLANSIGSSEAPHDVVIDEWEPQIEALVELIANDDGEGVWAWFKRHFPKCMKLVPARRRQQFVDGVKRANEDGRICV